MIYLFHFLVKHNREEINIYSAWIKLNLQLSQIEYAIYAVIKVTKSSRSRALLKWV